MKLRCLLAAAIFALLYGGAAHAHEAAGMSGGFISGFLHPIPG